MVARDVKCPLWAICCYFNPIGWRRRLVNYRQFRERLSVPLVAVELGYHPEFELREGDAEILIQLRGRDVLWQKERLLNVALRALPDSCEAVAWVDSDIIFTTDDWADRALRQLDRDVALQPFREVFDMRRDTRIDDIGRQPADRSSLASQIAGDRLPRESVCSFLLAVSPGHVWVARREVLDKHGLYDAAVVGGADRCMMAAAYGAWQGLETIHRWNQAQQRHYLEWAQPFFESVAGQVGYVEGGIACLWHGEHQDRGYRRRFDGLVPFQFDPATDIAMDENGAWRWNSWKPGLHEYVRDFFAARREDG